MCTICRQEIGIKTIQVRSSTTAPDNHDHIETVGMAVHPVQCRNHGLFRPFALHKSRKQFRIERIAALLFANWFRKSSYPAAVGEVMTAIRFGNVGNGNSLFSVKTPSSFNCRMISIRFRIMSPNV